MITRYQKITAMEPEELAEFLDNYEENLFGTCNSRFCEYSIEGGGCKAHPEGTCREATIKWLLAPIDGDEPSTKSDENRTVEDVGPYKCVSEQDESGLHERSGSLRKEILREAIKCVCTDRNAQYGEPEDNFSCIAEYWQKYLIDRCVEFGADVCITPEDVAVMMMLFKIARYITADRPSVDTFVDIAGYAACAGEICERHRCSVENEE